MQIVKMFAALLVAACAAQTFATQARANTSMAFSKDVGQYDCRRGSGSHEHFRYLRATHARRYYPGEHTRAPHPRRKFSTD